MASRKRELDSSDADDEPQYKRQRLNNNNNNNTVNTGRQHPHYLKYAPLINSIDVEYASANDEDVIITGTSSSTSRKDLQIRKLTNQCRELKERLRILKRIAISTYAPEYGIITIDKNNGTIASKRIALLKSKIMDIYSKSTINIKIKDTAHKKYSKAIKTFLKRNKNTINHCHNAEDPDIAISVDDNHGYVWKKQRDLLELLDDNKRNSDDTLIVEDLTDEHEAMSNVYVLSTDDIERGCVMGEYIGLQVTVDEMEDIYAYANQKCLANLYAFEIDIGIDEIDFDDDDEDNDEIEEIKEVIEEIRSEGSKIVIDAIGFQAMNEMDNLLMYISPVDKEDDRNVSNIEYVSAVINGWPRMFVVSKRGIGRGETLKGYFGEMFEMAEYQRLRDKRNRVRMAVYIDNMLKMPLFMTNREDIIL